MSDFRKALLWTAIPITSLSVISAAGAAFRVLLPGVTARFGFALSWNLFWFGAAACFLAAIVAAIVYAVKGKRQIMAGILVGIGIGIVSLGATCFVNLNLLW